MGCGASTVQSLISNPNQHPNGGVGVKSVQQNGVPVRNQSRSTLGRNVVTPAPIIHSIPEAHISSGSIEDITPDDNNNGDTNPGCENRRRPSILFTKSLSCIQEENRTVGIQTEMHEVHGIKSQFVQTDMDGLFPEDELELLMQEEMHVYFHDDDSSDVSSHDVRSDEEQQTRGNDLIREDEDDLQILEDSQLNQEKESPNRTRLTGAKGMKETGDVKSIGIQVMETREKTCQTKVSLLLNHASSSSTFSLCKDAADSIQKMEIDLTKIQEEDTHDHHDHKNDSNDHHEYLDAKVISRLEAAASCNDIESQTEPISSALAANSAGNDLNILHSFNISSPFSHMNDKLELTDQNTARNLQECLNRLLSDMESADGGINPPAAVILKKDVSVQTYDPITDEAPEFAARPPASRKKEMIPSISLFRDVDKKVLECPNVNWDSVQSLVDYLCEEAPNDLFKVRAIFRWITHNIKYDWKYMGLTLTPNEILQLREGVCKDYCLLFGEMCYSCGIRVKLIQGFAKGFEYRTGYQFKPGEDITHNWNAVYILGSWRFVDTTWGTGYTDHSGKFQQKLNEHFFLTDPEVLIWSHFPYDENESNYSRWQLLDKTITLNEFNGLPKVTPHFFEYNLKIRTKLTNPHTFRVQTEIKIGAHEAMRYKYKLFLADEVENSSLNHYAFCQLKEDRLVGSFIITPPLEGRFFLKVFTKPEREMLTGATDSSSLHSVVTFLIECTKARKYLEPFPLNELPWGPTQAFYDFKMKIHNLTGPIISSWGGKRKLTVECVDSMLITHQMMDAEGMEMDVRVYVMREDTGNKISFTISPPRVGMFKFMLFGMPKPKQKGKWRLPLLATFLVDCKLAKLHAPTEEDPPPLPADAIIYDNRSTPGSRRK